MPNDRGSSHSSGTGLAVAAALGAILAPAGAFAAFGELLLNYGWMLIFILTVLGALIGLFGGSMVASHLKPGTRPLQAALQFGELRPPFPAPSSASDAAGGCWRTVWRMQSWEA